MIFDASCKRVLFLEKYSTEKNGNKYTYVMIPANHPKYKFPYNLEDRIDYITKTLKDTIPFKFNMSKKKTKDEVIITIDYDDKFKDYQEVLDKFKELYDVNSPVRFSVETLDSIEEVRLFLSENPNIYRKIYFKI